MDRVPDTLLQRARDGDMDAFCTLFEGLRSRALGVATRMVGPDEAEDVVMDAFLRAWQGLPRFRAQSALNTWLYRIVHNCALDRIRHHARRPESRSGVNEEGEDWLERMPDEKGLRPDQYLERQEEAGAVTSALAGLPGIHRLALELRYGEGLSYGEIAAATGVSIGTVMSRLFHAKRKMKRILTAGL